MKTLLRVIEKASGEVVEEIDVTNETESGRREIRTGIRMQMNHAEFRLVEVEE